MAESSTQLRGSFNSSSSIRSRKYDVFLSFRGEDTRKNFTDHLFAALVRHRFSTYRDDEKLDRGEEIGAELLKAIEGSRIAIIVFSSNYATSRWCLNELVKIMECKKTLQQKVVPVFYDVDPSDVRAQTGTFAQALSRHEERYRGDGEIQGKMKSWKAALTEAANLSGWHLPNVANGHESKLIEKIVEDITIKLNIAYLNVATHPVDIEPRVQELNGLLSMESDGVRMVGIWGIGGLGKTTIAKAIYNHIYSQFEGSSFLANVRETSKQSNGLVGLQEQLLSDVQKRKRDRTINNVDEGIQVIKRELRSQRILLVLDDVDDMDQLKAFGIRDDWFGSGSRIIITTRDQSLLKYLTVDVVYEPQLLKPHDALQLFSWHAFKNEYPVENYVELSESVVSYAGGLPLALEVLGCFLCDKSMREWKSALEKLELVPHDKIQEKLKISYDSLNDAEKDLFLDIACLFFGTDQNYAMKILEGCGFFPEIGIGVLARRCLVRIDEFNKLTMHDMLRDMGREIVRRECLKEPGKRSRLWFHDDVIDVLTNHEGREEVEGLMLNLPMSNDVQLNSQAFAKMNKMRLLILNFVHVTGSYRYFSKRMVWLCWHGFPLKSIPSNLYLEKLVAIDMSYSNLKHVWNGKKDLHKLKFLNLSHSPHLTEIPDLSGVTSLEILQLDHCIRLVEVHQSIECLNKLVTLDLNNCEKLRKLPPGVFKLKSLQILNLDCCFEIENLVVSKVSSLVRFLQILNLDCCFEIENLVVSKVSSPVSLSPAFVRGSISIRILDMEYCTLSYVPVTLSDVMNKAVKTGSVINVLDGLNKYIKYIKEVSTADRCTSLEGISIGSDSSLFLTFSCCNKSVGNNFESDLRVRHLRYQGLFAMSEVPNWFTYKSVGSNLSFVVSPDGKQKIQAWILCVVYACFINVDDSFGVITGCRVTNKTKMTSMELSPKLGIYQMIRHQVLLHYVPNDCVIGPGDEMEFSVIADAARGQVEECGVKLIYEEDQTDYQSSREEGESSECETGHKPSVLEVFSGNFETVFMNTIAAVASYSLSGHHPSLK